MSSHGVERARALYEQGESDFSVRERLVEDGLTVRQAAQKMWEARRLLNRGRDGTIKTGSIRKIGADWSYVDKIVLPAEAAFLASLRANERPPMSVALDERSVPLRIGAFVE